MHPSHFQVAEDERPKMVEQWRMDALSLLEERLELLARHGRAMAASLRARAHMPLLVAGRMAFLRDMMCDAMVARMLWNQQRHLAIAVLCILGLPYAAGDMSVGLPTCGLRWPCLAYWACRTPSSCCCRCILPSPWTS